MIALKRISLRVLLMPLREPFRISSGTTTDRRVLLVELEDDDGTTMWSECVAGEDPNYFPDTVATSEVAIREWIGPRVLGRSIATAADTHGILCENFRGHPMARAAIEMGVWALAADKAGVSLAESLGGTRTEIATGISLGIQEHPDRLVEKTHEALSAGYNKIKIKIKPGADLRFVRAVRHELGEEAPLMVDANNAYTERDFDLLAQLDDLALLMIEQPLAWDDLVRHAALQRRLRTPVCLDESITGLSRAEDMVTLGSGRIVNIKPGRVGGFCESQAIHDYCAEHDVPVWCGGMLETGIGRAYNVALASLPNFRLPGDVSPSERYWTRDIVSPEWTMSPEGMVRVPRDTPGLGVQVDTARIEDLTVQMHTLTA